MFKAFKDDIFPETSAEVDYWGVHAFSETAPLIYGVYKGMYLMGINENAFHEHFLKNNLDEFIHKAYSKRSSGYYREFVSKDIKIGKTFYE